MVSCLSLYCYSCTTTRPCSWMRCDFVNIVDLCMHHFSEMYWLDQCFSFHDTSQIDSAVFRGFFTRPTPYLATRDDLERWLVRLHNTVRAPLHLFSHSKIMSPSDNPFLKGWAEAPTLTHQPIHDMANHEDLVKLMIFILLVTMTQHGRKTCANNLLLYCFFTNKWSLNQNSNYLCQQKTWKQVIPKGSVIFQSSIFRGQVLQRTFQVNLETGKAPVPEAEAWTLASCWQGKVLKIGSPFATHHFWGANW